MTVTGTSGPVGPEAYKGGEQGVEAASHDLGGGQPDADDPPRDDLQASDAETTGPLDVVPADSDTRAQNDRYPPPFDDFPGGSLENPDGQPFMGHSTMSGEPPAPADGQERRRRPRWLLVTAVAATAIAIFSGVMAARGCSTGGSTASPGGANSAPAKPGRNPGAASRGGSTSQASFSYPPAMTPDGPYQETIVRYPNGEVYTYMWGIGGLAAYGRGQNGTVLEETWNALTKKVSGKYTLECPDGSGGDVFEETPQGPLDLGKVAGACANGFTPFSYARGSAVAGQTSFNIVSKQ